MIPKNTRSLSRLHRGEQECSAFSACRAALATFDFPIAITLPSEPIVGELDLIPQFAADEEIHHTRQPAHQPHAQYPHPHPECPLRRNGRSAHPSLNLL